MTLTAMRAKFCKALCATLYYRPYPCDIRMQSCLLLHNSCVVHTINTAISSVHLARTIPAKYFLTTPIFYVNAVPHIGHLYTAVLADAVGRWCRILGCDVRFSTGTDEHGLKVQKSSSAQGKQPKQFCDDVSAEFQRLFKCSYISHSDFIRTTDSRHIEAAQHMWRILQDRGHIYKGHYSGWYCTSDEAFHTDDEVIDTTDEDGNNIKVSALSGHPVEWMDEENYMFRLSDFAPKLTEWLDQKVIQPSNFEPLVRSWIKDGLPDLSVSRQRSRLQWGIPVPDDNTQTMYVWLDALTNYLTVAGYPSAMTDDDWPVDCHVIGKDILRFHAIYWPAFLMAAGLQPPRKILCHSHWMVNHKKMSKSVGNVVDPFDRLSRYTPDGLRYFLLREGVPHSDGNYSDDRVMEVINVELANTLGNLLSRCSTPRLNPEQRIPGWKPEVFHAWATTEQSAMVEDLFDLPGIVDGHYRDYNVYKGLDAIMTQLRRTNAFVQDNAPWELVNVDSKKPWLDMVMHVTMETLRVSAILLQPATPNLADRLLNRLNVAETQRKWSDLKHRTMSCSLGSEDGVLFERLKASS